MSSSSNITRHKFLSHPCSHNCHQLKRCESLKRMAQMLNEYHNVHNQTSRSLRTKNKLMITYLKLYIHLINDYHHLLTTHLSHSNHSKNLQNLNYIHSKIPKCDIHKCKAFIIHYKYQYHYIDSQSTHNRIDSFTLHYLRGIHIHFAHPLDTGFRSYFTPNILHSDPKNSAFDQELINQLLLFNFGDRDDIINAMRIATNINDVNEIVDILQEMNDQKHNHAIAQLSSSEFYEDGQMIAIQNEIQKKRKRLVSWRGSHRMKHNKFSTNITTSTKTSATKKPRRASRKMNKLLPNPSTANTMLTHSNRLNIEDVDNAHDTFSTRLHKYLAQNGVASDILIAFDEWRENMKYDSDWIVLDIAIAVQKGSHESHIHQFCRLKNQIKCFNKIKHFVASNTASAEANTVIKVANTEQSDKPNNVKRGSREYVFGQRFYYWQTHDTEPWFVEPKYSSFKEEILNLMDVNVFHSCFVKATQLHKGSDVLKAIRSNKDGQTLSVSNLLSIIFYTDCDVLSAKFKSTFYKLTSGESDKAQKERHRMFWNWSKILTETIECYGVPFRFNKIDTLYHNTTFMYYSLFTATFNAPTSMTRYIEVAAMYCDPDGIILELAQFPKIRPKYFDCSLVSSHGIEHELLFIGGDKSMDITSIRVIKSNEDHQAFIKAMRLFNKVMRATILSKLERCGIIQSDYIIIERLIQLQKNHFPKYMNESFRRCCADKRRIRMDCFCLRDGRHYRPYGSWFMHPYHAINLVKFEFICRLFPNVLCIESWDTGPIKSLYLAELKNVLIAINKMGDKVKLKRIVIHCDAFQDLDVKRLNMQKKRFRQLNWIIRMVEPWQLVLFNIANKKL
eukprot:92797_1